IEKSAAIDIITVGIYVSRDTPGNYSFDVGIIMEGVLVLKDLDNVAIAVAMCFGLFYSVNMSYPSQLRYTFEVKVQKVVMGLDATQLSRKTLSKTAHVSKVHCCCARKVFISLTGSPAFWTFNFQDK
uniref:Uncharacterized protein n=1 Tax=Neolamprologus brichardi TaxID=32507 RepID=A0A3Q4HIB0_NEOBR